MLDVLRWLITVEIIGLAAFPLAFYLLPRLADRGFTLSKPFGILLVSYLFWILGLAHVPTVQPIAMTLVLFMAAASAYIAYRNFGELRDFIAREWRTLVIAEAVFLIFFIGWTLFRSYDPFINHTEQPMDLALLSASINSQVGHPEDPWLRGESISYYYFGYWMMGAISQIAAVPSNIAYNLAMALIPALAATGIFGLVVNMARGDGSVPNMVRAVVKPVRPELVEGQTTSATPIDKARWGYAVVAGIAATLFLGIVSNLEGVLEFMRLNGMGSQGFYDWIRINGLDGPADMPPQSWTPPDFWWWFHASRVINTFDGIHFIDNTIQEFPFFSFLLGDMHPHVMSVPFVLLFMGVALNIYRLPADFWREYRSVYPYAIVLMAAVVLGGLGFNNLWDMPTFAALLIGVLALRQYREGNDIRQSFALALFPVGLAIIALAVLMYSPYLLDINAGVNGIGVVVTHTRAVHMFIVWGLFLAAVAPFLLATFWQTTVQRDWTAQAFTALALAFVPWLLWALAYLPSDGSIEEAIGRFIGILPLTGLAAIGVYNALYLARQENEGGRLFATLLAVLGLGLIIGAEFLFIRDFFNNRGNTVFKLYYQAWILLAAASAFAVYYWLNTIGNLKGWRTALSYVWAGTFVLLLLGSLYYPLAAAKTKPDTPYAGRTLDGLSYVRQNNPAEYDAIEWLKQNAPPDTAIVEAVGEWSDWGIISRTTGLPTIVNWLGHQKQWRGGWEQFDAETPEDSRALRDQYFNDRAGEVERIYTTLDPAEAQLILYKYDIDYVYIGSREREKYGIEGIHKFDAIAAPVFQQGDVVIYSVN
ncbi:MAG: hypothetical protein F4X34_01430 [Chloroflexi bacterium]|nr:hypothetical protein [Chloroflexota bacterium]